MQNLQLNKIIIETRSSDNFVNATQICKAGGARFNDWYKSDSTKRFIKALEKDQKYNLNLATTNGGSGNLDKIEVNSIKLVDITRGGKYQGSWIHPDLAVDLAQWISPEFKLKVSRWVRELYVTGATTLNSKLKDKELNELTQKLHETQITNNENTEKLELLQTKLVISEKKNLELISNIYNDKIHKLDGFVYLVTSDVYVQSNNYKLGRCSDLVKRLAPYQVGRPDNDLMYYVFIYESEDVVYLEYTLQYFLKEYRQNASKDIYVLPWPIISKYLKYICDSIHNGIVPETNLMIKSNLDYDITLPIVIPKKLNLSNSLLIEAPAVDLQCHKCGKVLCNTNSLKNHLKKVIPCDRIIQCNKCEKIFSIMSKLLGHLKRKKPCI